MGSDKIILTTKHTIPLIIVSPPTGPKDIDQAGLRLVLGQQQSKYITDDGLYCAVVKEQVGSPSTRLQANTYVYLDSEIDENSVDFCTLIYDIVMQKYNSISIDIKSAVIYMCNDCRQ